MDRNQSIGLVLISLILLGYLFFFAPEPPKTNFENPKTDSLVSRRHERLQKEQAATISPANDSAQQAANAAKLGEFAAAGTGTAKSFTLQNDNVQISISSLGGQFQRVWLKKFKTFDKKPLVLLDSASSHRSLVVETQSGKQIDLHALYYTGQASGNKLTLTANLGDNQAVEQVYTLDPEGYTVKNEVRLRGISQALADKPGAFTWHDNIKRNEYDLQTDRTRTTINYFTADDKAFDEVSASATDAESEKVEQAVKWVAHKEKFFTSAVIADEPFSGANLKTSVPKDSSAVKMQEAALAIPAKALADGALGFTYYFGPNNFKVLNKVTEGFEKNLDLGWGIFAWVNKLIIINVFRLPGGLYRQLTG